ncbi:MAG: DUF4157 domain-containing protein [Lentimicrobium sp.]|nr:DUF4157 domain-containing protein [Lentimicrobium sp.]
MKTTAEKSSATTVSATHTAGSPFFAKAGGGDFFAPVSRGAPASVQTKLTVNKPGDQHEVEADKMAEKVMRMPASSSTDEKIQRSTQPEEKIQKTAAPEEKIQKKEEDKLQRKGNGVPVAGANVQSSIRSKTNGGAPLSASTRSFMESRFNADFSKVRIHSDPESANLSNQLSARAFTYQNHIFFSRDQYQPGSGEGKQLLAHELTHTIQQGHAIQRSPQVTTTASPPAIQRLGIQDALNYFADKAYYIPGFRMLTIILGFNPINMRSTDRNAANILRALIEMVPGGHFITQALDNHGVFSKAGAWVEQQIGILGDIGIDIVSGLRRFLNSLGWRDIFDLGGVWDRAKRIFTDPIGRIISFSRNIVTGILRLVKDAILKPLAALAQGTRGYDLLRALLGEDPITGEPVPRNAETLIGGFMKLIGKEEIWENIKKGNAVARAWAWFQGTLQGLLGMARSIPRQIMNTLSSLTFQDIITIGGALSKIIGTFANIASNFMSWAFNQVISLLEIIFSVVAPGAMPYISKARAAFISIIQNPIGFVGNLVRAGKLGFQLFATNIVTHLKTALIKWITGPLGDAGVYIPKSFSLMEIIKLVLSVLGLTWQNIRSKLVKIIPEPVLTGLEKTAGILVTLVKDGPAAAWEQIKTELSELKDQLIEKITEMVSVEIVKAAVLKLVMMLNPAGAVVQAIIAIYNTITFFIEKINQIAAVVGSFINSIAAIAAGQVMGAAKKVEQTMANTLVVIIGFLAKFAGLGNIPKKLVDIVKKIRKPIDKGLDKIVAWLGRMLQKGKQVVANVLQWWKTRVSFKNADGEDHALSFQGENESAVLTVESTPRPLVTYLTIYETDNKPDASKKEIIKQIRTKVTKLENIKSNYGKRNRSGFGAKDGEDIQLIFKDIAGLLAQLEGDGGPPETKVVWNSPNEDGISMTAMPLSINPGKFAGSQPGEESTLWKKVRTHFPGKYVRGHLLNHHVHGSGTKQNLTPISIGANNRMERIAESAVKKAVLDEKKTLRYSVRVVSFHNQITGFPESKKLPAEMHMQAVELKKKNQGWEDKGTLVNESVSSPIP